MHAHTHTQENGPDKNALASLKSCPNITSIYQSINQSKMHRHFPIWHIPSVIFLGGGRGGGGWVGNGFWCPTRNTKCQNRKKFTDGIRRRSKTDICEDNFAKHMKIPAKLELNLKHKPRAQTINGSEWAIGEDWWARNFYGASHGAFIYSVNR